MNGGITGGCLLKLLSAIIFIIIGIVLNCGGGKNEYSEYVSRISTDERVRIWLTEVLLQIGGKYWHNPGSLANGFHGICAVSRRLPIDHESYRG